MQPRLESPIFQAIRDKNAQEIRNHADWGINLIITGREGLNPFELAAKLESWDCLQALAECHGKSDFNNSEWIALKAAVKANQILAVKALLESYPSPRIPQLTWHEGNALLHWAAQNKNADMVKLLLEHGCDLSEKNKNGKTPAQVAADVKAFNCVNVMADYASESEDSHRFNYGYALLFASRQMNN